MKIRFLAVLPLAICALSLLPRPSQADPRSIMGSGNFDLQYNGDFGTQFDVLNANSVKTARINAYPGDYWNGSSAVTSATMDNAIKLAYSKGITPIMHFSYYANNLSNNSLQLGNKAKWTAVGQAYATRYRPNSLWLQSQGINNWGVSIYLALNEADLDYWWTRGAYNGVPDNSGIPINASSPYVSQFGGNYHDALEGLSDGVKGVSSALKVVNGGFATQNSARSYNARGYASGIADLFNNGKLDGLNLHTYNDAKYAPLYPDQGWNNEWAVFRQFALVKSNSGITRDIDFYTDEFNYKNVDRDDNGVVYDEDRTARQLFTMIWQNLGVPKNDGTSATKLAMLWSLLYCEPIYTTFNGSSLSPYSPRKAAKTYAFIAQQTAGMEYSTLDPFNSGEWTLVGGGKKIWVWTNMKTYTNHLGGDWTVNGIPAGSSQLQVYGWDGFNGPRQTINLSGGQTSATISGLAQNETYMVVSVPGSGSSGSTSDSQIGTTSWSANRVDVFIKGLDNGIWTKNWSGSAWGGWSSPFSTTVTGGFGASNWGVNRLDIFYTDANNTPIHAWNGGSWSSENLSGAIIGSPTATAWSNNRLDILGRGTDNQLHWKYWNGSAFVGWTALGGTLSSSPAVTNWGAGRLDVFYAGSDRSLRHRWYVANGWSSEENLGGILVGAPTAVAPTNNTINVFVRGTDNNLHMLNWNGSSWSGWNNLGRTLSSSPAATSHGNVLDVFYKGSNSALKHSFYLNGAWNEEDLGGQLP